MLTHFEDQQISEHRSDMSLVLRLQGSFFLAYFLAVIGPRILPQVTGLRVFLGLLAIVIFALVVRIEIHALRTADEMQRRIRLEALATAYPISLLLTIAAVVFQRLLEIPVEWVYRALLVLLPIPYYAGLKSARKRYS
jgi:hypothetical protein